MTMHHVRPDLIKDTEKFLVYLEESVYGKGGDIIDLIDALWVVLGTAYSSGMISKPVPRDWLEEDIMMRSLSLVNDVVGFTNKSYNDGNKPE